MATTAGEVLLAYLAQQLDELRRYARRIRYRQPEAVHQMRVAARRLRSLLASGRALFEDAAVERLRAELRWLSGVLGGARDPEVVHARLSVLLAEEPEELRFGPAARRIDEELEALAAVGFEAALAALESGRYQDLLAGLDRFLAEAPQSPAASRPAGTGIGRLVARDLRRLERAVASLPPADDGGAGRDAGLHEVRKAAKRLRYSAELAASLPKAAARSATGKNAAGTKKSGEKLRRRAKRSAKWARRIQRILGLHQDSVVARARLAELGGRALRSGENGFSYGRLHAREESLAAASERAFLKLWKRKHPAR